MNKRVIKYTKPTSEPLVIGGGGAKPKKASPRTSSAGFKGGLVIGTKGVVKSPVSPIKKEQKKKEGPELLPPPPSVEVNEFPAAEGNPSAVTAVAPAGASASGFDPNTARTIRKEKMIEEKMARAEQMLEDAELKQKLANQQLEEAQIKAKEIVKEAQVKAKKLIEDAKQYCQQLQAGAEREGFEQGKELGLEAGKQEVGALMQQAMGVINYIVEERRKVYDGLEPQVADLAIKIAEKIIQTEVTLNNDIVINLIKSNLDKVKDREQITVRVNQDDYDYVKENEDSIRKMLEGVKRFRIEADGVVEKGGCMIDTDLGNLDARVDFQLDILKLAFENMKVQGG